VTQLRIEGTNSTSGPKEQSSDAKEITSSNGLELKETRDIRTWEKYGREGIEASGD